MKKPKNKKIKAWAVIHRELREEDVIIGFLNVKLEIYTEDCKVFADKFAEARNKMGDDKCTKVIPIEITIKNK